MLRETIQTWRRRKYKQRPVTRQKVTCLESHGCDRLACPIYTSLLEHKRHTFKYLYKIFYINIFHFFFFLKISIPLANNNIFIFKALNKKRKRDWLIGNAPVVKSHWLAKKSSVQFPIFS